jgi:hypothetical protein
MPDIAALVESLGGMAQKQQLVARGARDLDLTLAVRRGDVSRARQGWYTTLPLDDPRVRAVCVGGRLTGISAVIALGGWAPGRFPLHVSVHDNAARLRTPWSRFVRLAGRIVRGLTLHWDDSAVASRGDAMLVDLRDALLRVVLDEQFETAVAALDWALHTGRLDRIDFELLVLRLPKDMRHISEWVDERCESLPESLARTRLRLLGHSVESQVRVNDLERIDLVVDDCVGLETDGEEFHVDRFESDRTKDIAITIANLHALRPSARMVFRQWHRVALAVETAIAARSRVGAGHASPRVRQPSPLARRGRGWPRPGAASSCNASGPARRSTRASGAMVRPTQLSVPAANHPHRE